MLKITLILILLGFFSFFLVWGIIKISLKRSLLNYPNERSLHKTPTPRLGGLAIIITWYLGLIIFYQLDLIEQNLFYALLCGILLALISFLDDLIEIKAIIRLIIHFVVAIAAFYFLKGMRPFINPEIEAEYYYFIYPLVIIGMVWFINLYNFMDGINGFVSIEAITIALFMFFFTFNPLNLVLVVAVLGFFYWNWPNAKIFMGDVGSTQLGFVLIVLGIYFHNTQQFSICYWIMITSVFWFDATLTLFRRWRNKEKLSQAHRKHAYQRIVQSGFSHLKTDVWLIITNLVILLFVFVIHIYNKLFLPLFIANIILLFLLLKAIDRKYPFKK
jgi:UDP-N-acetylmuramyl pentapeptide phosphotransferase/UDP-N-acetylglucosamine-1-phosphate transferase